MKIKLFIFFCILTCSTIQSQSFVDRFNIIHSLGDDSRTIYERFKDDYPTEFMPNNYGGGEFLNVMIGSTGYNFHFNDDDEAFSVIIVSDSRDVMYMWCDVFDIKYKSSFIGGVFFGDKISRFGEKYYSISIVSEARNHSFTIELNE